MCALISNPDSIVITWPVKFLMDYAKALHPGLRWHFNKNKVIHNQKELIKTGYMALCDEIDQLIKEPEHGYWMVKMHHKPNFPIEWVYITVLGKIKWRANILRWEEGSTKEFPDGRTLTAKHWLLLCNFVQAPIYMPFQGTQGFRYTDKIF